MREDVQTLNNHFKDLYKNLPDFKDAGIMEQIFERRKVIDNYGSVGGKPPKIDETAIIKAVKIRGIPCEWICAPNADKNKRLLYLHGGAFVAGSLDSHRGVCCELSKRAGVAVLNVGYRLAPEHPFPAGLDDCYDAYDWILENGPEEKSRAKKVFVAGDSAGGNLTLSLLLKLKNSILPLPDAALAVSPVLDLSARSVSVDTLDGFDPVLNKKALRRGLPMVYLFGKDVLNMEKSKFHKLSLILKILKSKNKLIKNPLVSPLFGDLKGLPPILINVGEVEILRDDSIRFVDKARRQGVNATVKVWANMPHVFIAFLDHVPEAEECFEDMAKFIKRYS